MSATPIREAMPPSTLRQLAALPPADDEEAGAITPPTLGLTEEDVAQIRHLSRAWSEAKAKAVEAEQTYTAASRAAARLNEHQRAAGESAARAWTMNGKGKALATSVVEQIDLAKQAALAMPALERAVSAARDEAAAARGVLHTATTNALRGAIRRASAHWSALALEATRVVASLEACVHALPSKAVADMVSPWALFKGRLMLPALPTVELNIPWDRAATDQRFMSTLLSVEHPRLTAHVKASEGWLYQQLTEALGFSPRTLLG